MSSDHAALPVHPTPQRWRISSGLLFLGLALGPFGWITQLLTTYALSSLLCSAARAHGDLGAGSAKEIALLLAINLLCLLIVAAGAGLSFSHWSKTQAERGGDPRAAISIGEGRTRFISGCGIASAAIFAVAILFNTLEPLIVPTCWGTAR